MPGVEIESTRSLAASFGQHPIWGWEIPVYLFLGGLAAGLTIAVAVRVLQMGKERVTRGMRLGLSLAPVLVSLGMGALFIDLSYKAHVFRFYTTFQPTSPMSWGAFILLVVYPVHGLLLLLLPPEWLAPRLSQLAQKQPMAQRVIAFAERNQRAIAKAGLAAGVALGIYTGVLLAATVARPLWSSSALGPLFLVSGLSTAVALLMLLERDDGTHRLLSKVDIGLIVAEISLLLLWILGLMTQGPLYREAVGQLLWGPFAPAFLGFVVFGGLIVPAALEALALSGRAKSSRLVPALVLISGLLLRFVVVAAGQTVGFVNA